MGGIQSGRVDFEGFPPCGSFSEGDFRTLSASIQCRINYVAANAARARDEIVAHFSCRVPESGVDALREDALLALSLTLKRQERQLLRQSSLRPTLPSKSFLIREVQTLWRAQHACRPNY